MDIKAGSTTPTVPIAAFTTATGAAVTITSATAGLSLWYRRGVTGAKVPIMPSDLATLETAYAEGGLLVVGGQEHRLDLPVAAAAVGVDTVTWGGEATDITIDGGTANLIGQATTAATTDSAQTAAAAAIAAAAIPAGVVAALGNGSALTEAGGTGDHLTAIPGISGGSGTGSNTIQFEITNSSGTLLENATVTLRLNDILKATGDTLATGRLSGTGLAVATTGSYELSVTCGGYNGYTASLVVTAGVNALVEVELTPLSIPIPVDPNLCTGVLKLIDEDGSPDVGGSASLVITTGPGTDGLSYDISPWTKVADGNGNCIFGSANTGLIRGATYRIYRGSSSRIYAEFTCPTDEDSFSINEVLGKD